MTNIAWDARGGVYHDQSKIKSTYQVTAWGDLKLRAKFTHQVSSLWTARVLADDLLNSPEVEFVSIFNELTGETERVRR